MRHTARERADGTPILRDPLSRDLGIGADTGWWIGQRTKLVVGF